MRRRMHSGQAKKIHAYSALGVPFEPLSRNSPTAQTLPVAAH
jgi:hypothetical protein